MKDVRLLKRSCLITLNILLYLCSFSLLFSQTTDIKEFYEDSLKNNEEKKRSIYEKIIGEIHQTSNYKVLRDRVIVQTKAAELIWEHDAEFAAETLRKAFAVAETATAVLSETEKENKTAAALKNDLLRRELRAEIMLIAARKDTALLRELIDGLIEEDEQHLNKLRSEPSVFGSTSFNKRLIAYFSALLAKDEPQLALDYAKLSLGHGVPFEINSVFDAFLPQRKDLAHELFRFATEFVLTDPSLNLYDAQILAGYLSKTAPNGADLELAHRLLSGDLMRKQKLWQSIQTGNVADNNLSGAILITSQTLYELYQKYHRQRTGDVEIFIRQMSAAMGRPPEFADQTIAEAASSNDPEVLLKEAEKETNVENKNALYLEAALAFMRGREYEKALNAGGKAEDETKRKAVQDIIRKNNAEFSIGILEDQAKAARLIEQIEEPELMAEAVLTFVRQMVRIKEPHTARQMLVSAQRRLEKGFANAATARAYLWLASAYTELDPMLGFELMNAAVKRANQTKDLYDLKPDPKIIHLGGKSIQAVRIGDATGDLTLGFRVLAEDNFLQAVSLAENFENSFFRGYAILEISAVALRRFKNEETSLKK